MKVAVVTPIYRYISFFDELCDAMAATGSAVNWIVVDDGSPLPDSERIQSAVRRVRNAHYFRTDNLGACHARNFGLGFAEAPWVHFVDADDYPGPDFYRECARIVQAQPHCRMVLGETWIAGPRGSVLKRPLPRQDWRALLCCNAGTPCFHHSAGLYRAEDIRAIGGWNETLQADQDGDFQFRYLLKCRPSIAFADSAGFVHRDHREPGRISVTNSLAKLECRIRTTASMELVAQDPVFGTGLLQQAIALRWEGIAAVAVSQWPELAADCMARARRIAPGYRSGVKLPIRLLGRIVGEIRVLKLQQWLRGTRAYGAAGAAKMQIRRWIRR